MMKNVITGHYTNGSYIWGEKRECVAEWQCLGKELCCARAHSAFSVKRLKKKTKNGKRI